MGFLFSSPKPAQVSEAPKRPVREAPPKVQAELELRRAIDRTEKLTRGVRVPGHSIADNAAVKLGWVWVQIEDMKECRARKYLRGHFACAAG